MGDRLSLGAVALLVALALASGCPAARTTGTTTQPAAPAPAPPASTAGPALTAPHPGRAETCLDACVRRNQMRAVSLEAIRADCRKECDRCVESCQRKNAMRAVSAEQISADCRRRCRWR